MKKILFSSALLLAFGASANSPEFNTFFNDSTLRLDYSFSGDVNRQHVAVDKLIKSSGWAGRRNHLNELHAEGNGQITVRDEASGDTIYRHPFSSLFLEWLDTDEAKTRPSAFGESYLIPFPKKPVLVDVVLFDSRRKEAAKLTHRVDPADILIRKAGERNITPHRYLHKSGDPKDKIDIAILAEGYTVEEMDSFYMHAQQAVDALLSHAPFDKYADSFNIVAVASPSNESGVSVPRFGDWKDTAFGSHFSTFYSNRYLTAGDIPSIHDALAGIPYEHIAILANTEEYGGGGIFNSYTLTAARHKNMKPVVVHELGHSLVGLTDEYFYDNDVMTDTTPKDVEPWQANVTTLVDFNKKPWAKMLKSNTPVPTPVVDKDKYPVGVYEGAAYCAHGVYRPADECRMRNNTYPTFCPVCQDAIERWILFYTK